MLLESEVMGVAQDEEREVDNPSDEDGDELEDEEERWVDNLFDEDGNELTDDELEQQCAAEQVLQETMPTPDEEPQTEAQVLRRRLKREIQAEALNRLETAARTDDEYAAVMKWWDRLDRNRERRERSYEVLRGDVPME